MAKVLDSRLGKIKKFRNNPRRMDDPARKRLEESVERRTKFMEVRNIVVWRVPEDVAVTHPLSPFVGQEGEMVVLGGNQRYDALLKLGYTRIPDEYIIEARDSVDGVRSGAWWTPEEAEAFVLMDNNQEGMAGENDYEALMAKFDRERMKEAGINFAEMPQEYAEADVESTEDEIESGEHGEMDEDLKGFIERREKSRGAVEEMTENGFYCVPYFETHEQNIQFQRFLKEKYGIETEKERWIDGFELAEALGCHLERSEFEWPESKPVSVFVNLALDGTEEGYEVGGEEPEETEELDEETESDEVGDDWLIEDDGIKKQ